MHLDRIFLFFQKRSPPVSFRNMCESMKIKINITVGSKQIESVTKFKFYNVQNINCIFNSKVRIRICFVNVRVDYGKSIFRSLGKTVFT